MLTLESKAKIDFTLTSITPLGTGKYKAVVVTQPENDRQADVITEICQAEWYRVETEETDIIDSDNVVESQFCPGKKLKVIFDVTSKNLDLIARAFLTQVCFDSDYIHVNTLLLRPDSTDIVWPTKKGPGDCPLISIPIEQYEFDEIEFLQINYNFINVTDEAGNPEPVWSTKNGFSITTAVVTQKKFINQGGTKE